MNSSEDDPQRPLTDEELKVAHLRKSPKLWFLARGNLRAYWSALLLFVIEDGLPQDQRWLWYTLMLHHRQYFSNRIYPFSLPVVFLLWLYPNIQPTVLFQLTIAFDIYERTNASMWDYNQSVISQFGIAVTWLLLRLLFDISDLTPGLERVLGPSSSWPRAVIPILPAIVLRGEQSSINGFIPEGKEGIYYAFIVWTATAVLPFPVQWGLWAAYASPGRSKTLSLVTFALYSLAWVCMMTPLPVAYTLHLFINQFVHHEFHFRHKGGGPSTILVRERRGCILFAVSSFLFKAGELEYTSAYGKSAPSLPPHVWIPVMLVLASGFYLLKYGFTFRRNMFTHKGIRAHDGFRLLRVRPQPCFGDWPIRCDMLHVTLHSPPIYTAVSHRWLDEKSCVILIDEAPFIVPESLFVFLRAKRDLRESVLLWIDTICINQTDAEEKNSQVQIMRRIFEEADTTIGWLGASPGASKAFNLVARICVSPGIQLPQDGWQELLEMLSHSWFERMWIIQEVAVSDRLVIRYGDHEVPWTTFAIAISHLHTASLLQNPRVMNILVMDHMRQLCAGLDLLRLEDSLKIGRRFQATLAVDKVYALLGIVEERDSPLFHPKFSAAKSYDARAEHIGKVQDVFSTLGNMVNFFGSINGVANTRRDRATMKSPAKLLRHMHQMSKSLGKAVSRMKTMTTAGGFSRLDLDYSDKTTPELVFILTARELVEDKRTSFLRHAGVSTASGKFRNLPSWVPDWSIDLDTFLLPYELPAHNQQEETARGGGSTFLDIQGAVVGKIHKLSPLSKHYIVERGEAGDKLSDVFKDAKLDFYRQSSNFKVALSLAHQLCSQAYRDIDDAFFRTTLANYGRNGPAAVGEVQLWRAWIEGERTDCDISAVMKGSDELRDDARQICEQYLFIRQMQSSSNTRFAHLLKSDVIPSFRSYRFKVSSESKEKAKEPAEEAKRPSGSIFERSDLLSRYDKYVDFTIGRKLAILESGHMGLVPISAQEGDVAVRVENMCLLLRPVNREEELLDLQQDASKPPVSVDDVFQLVGESYVHGLPNPDSDTSERWFKLC